MFEPIKRKIKEQRIIIEAKRQLNPSDEFLARAKGVFLNKLEENQPVTNRVFKRSYIGRHKFAYGFALLVIIFFLNSGAIVLAEKNNVDPLHPLYPFKRLGENIRVTLASADKKPELHRELAQKRLEEIKKIKSLNADSQKIEAVRNNLNHEMNSAIIDASAINPEEEQMFELCLSLSEIISEKKEISLNEDRPEAEELSVFDGQCGKFNNTNGNDEI